MQKTKTHEYFFKAEGRVYSELEEWEIRDMITEAVQEAVQADIVDTSIEEGDA